MGSSTTLMNGFAWHHLDQNVFPALDIASAHTVLETVHDNSVVGCALFLRQDFAFPVYKDVSLCMKIFTRMPCEPQCYLPAATTVTCEA